MDVDMILQLYGDDHDAFSATLVSISSLLYPSLQFHYVYK